MDSTLVNQLAKKLDIIINLMLKKVGDKNLSLKDQVQLLDGLGCRPIEIASILGKTPTHISKELAGLRKLTKGKKNG